MATDGPLHDDDPSLQARGLAALSFTPSGADSALFDASSCTTNLAMCRCGVHLVVLRSSVRDSVTLKSSSCPTRASRPSRCRCGPRGHAHGLGCRTSYGFRASGPFASIPSERHCSASHD
nr:hypothetical protein CFP56_18109 [Quercus suber]